MKSVVLVLSCLSILILHLKGGGLKVELKRVKVDHELNQTMMTFSNIRIVSIVRELDGVKIASKEVGLEKDKLLEERKTLKANF